MELLEFEYDFGYLSGLFQAKNGYRFTWSAYRPNLKGLKRIFKKHYFKKLAKSFFERKGV